MKITEAPAPFGSIERVSDSRMYSGTGADTAGPPDWLIELPHGATRESDYDATKRLLSGHLPDSVKDFFFVNTDAGAPEYADAVARMIVEPASHPLVAELLGTGGASSVARLPPRKVLLVRSLVPRTFIDCNRVIELDGRDTVGALSRALPPYIRERRDAETLVELYRRYRELVERAYAEVCGADARGMALQLHTYAPRSIQIEDIDERIGEAIRRAYEPATYDRWPERPDVDLISEDDDGNHLAPPGLVEAVQAAYERIGIRAAENATYRLHPPSLGFLFASRYRGRLLCVEIGRARLADPFTPFAEMRISQESAWRMAAPIAASCLALSAQGRWRSGAAPRDQRT